MKLLVALLLVLGLSGCAIEYREDGKVKSIKMLEPSYTAVSYEYGWGYYRPVYRRYYQPRVVYERRVVVREVRVREPVRHEHRPHHDDCR